MCVCVHIPIFCLLNISGWDPRSRKLVAYGRVGNGDLLLYIFLPYAVRFFYHVSVLSSY